jgi:REP element-mobilizing transposase RayT
MKYRRADTPGGTYFFTVNLADRSGNLLVAHIESLRQAIRKIRQSHPFDIIAMVVLPDHLHAIWRLPEGDANFPMRWALIKSQIVDTNKTVKTPARIGFAGLTHQFNRTLAITNSKE